MEDDPYLRKFDPHKRDVGSWTQLHLVQKKSELKEIWTNSFEILLGTLFSEGSRGGWKQVGEEREMKDMMRENGRIRGIMMSEMC